MASHTGQTAQWRALTSLHSLRRCQDNVIFFPPPNSDSVTLYGSPEGRKQCGQRCSAHSSYTPKELAASHTLSGSKQLNLASSPLQLEIGGSHADVRKADNASSEVYFLQASLFSGTHYVSSCLH